MPGRFDHFDWIAPFYDRALQYRRAQHLIQILALPVEGLLLDGGGGTGRVAQLLMGLAAHVVVADVSAGMLRQAAKKDGLSPVCTPTERLPFPDASFERVIMVDALHHVHSQVQTIRELWRVLRPGGRIVIEEPDLRIWGVKVIALAEKLLLMRSHFLAPARIVALFPDEGVRKWVEVEEANAWVIVEKLKG